MATIYQYVKETTHINDTPYAPVNVRVYETEQESIEESVKTIIIPNYTISINPDTYINYGYICNNVKSTICCYKTSAIRSYVNINQEEPKSNLIGNIGTINTYNNIQTKQIYVTKLFKYENTIKSSSHKFEFDLGLLTSITEITVTLYSTYDEDITIDQVSPTYNIGIDTTFNNGNVIPAHGNLTFSFLVKVNEGKPILHNDKIWFKLSNGLTIYWTWCLVRTQDLYYFPFPDKNKYQENFIYFSKNFISLKGAEDVTPFINIPKKAFSASYSFLKENEIVSVENVLLKNEYLEVFFPLWSEAVSPTTDTVVATPNICPPRISEFIKPQTYIVIQSSKDALDYKILKVVDVDYFDNLIIVNAPIAYKSSDFIIPLLKVVPATNPNKKYYNIKDTTLNVNVRTLR